MQLSRTRTTDRAKVGDEESEQGDVPIGEARNSPPQTRMADSRCDRRLAAILSAMSGRRRATVFPEAMAPGDDDRLRAPREPPARPLPGLRTGIGAVQPGVAAALRTIAPPHGFDLASAKAPRLGAGARRAAANLADLGRRVTDANSALVDAILALPAKLDPLRAAALTALPCVRSRPRPACAGPRHRSPVRRRDRRGRQPKAACRKHAGGPEGVLACFARGLCGRAPAALRPHLIEIAAVRSSSS